MGSYQIYGVDDSGRRHLIANTDSARRALAFRDANATGWNSITVQNTFGGLTEDELRALANAEASLFR